MQTAIERYAREFYDLLAENAHKVVNGEQVEELVFRGSLVNVFQQVGCSKSYYSKLRGLLEECGSIEMTRRGSRGFDSLVTLYGAPPPNAFDGLSLTLSPASATIAELAERVSQLEAWRESLGKGDLNITEALRSHEQRLAKLEKKDANAKVKDKATRKTPKF